MGFHGGVQTRQWVILKLTVTPTLKRCGSRTTSDVFFSRGWGYIWGSYLCFPRFLCMPCRAPKGKLVNDAFDSPTPTPTVRGPRRTLQGLPHRGGFLLQAVPDKPGTTPCKLARTLVSQSLCDEARTLPRSPVAGLFATVDPLQNRHRLNGYLA